MVCCSVSASAGPGPSAWRSALQRVFGKPAVQTPAVLPAAAQSIEQQVLLSRELNRSAAMYWKSSHSLVPPGQSRLPYQSMAGVSSKSIRPATAEDSRFTIINNRMAALWLSVTARDLALMQARKDDMLRSLQVAYPQAPVNYAALIPEKARYIAVGEEHGFPALRQAFEELVFQYRAMYPKRKIIVLTEFVFDRTLPLSEKTGLPVSSLALKYRRVSPDFKFLDKFVKNGIDVIGLEDERYFRNHQQLITPSFRQVESVYGMKQRNDHWRKIIEDVRQREPGAVFFIYTGNMHVHYRAPFTLARSSPQVFVLQLLAKDLGKDLPFGAVMLDQPFARARAKTAFPTLLSWPATSPYRPLSGFDACLIFPAR